MKSRGGFTLVEILIVVVILGILAAIVVPQFTEASGEAKESRLLSDLQSCRSQIELYKMQHTGLLPSAAAAGFVVAMTGYTNTDGTAPVAQTPAPGVYGPYLQKMPSNPFATAGNGQVVVNVAAPPAAAIADTGWFFNTNTGEFGAASSFTDSSGATDNHFEW